MPVRFLSLPAIMLPACLALAACQADTVTPTPDPIAASCGADALQGLVGGPLAAFTPPPQAGAVRVIGPDMAVTMDFRQDRLNVEHTQGQIILRIFCG